MSSKPRRTHRKRMSAVRISTDTFSTLPEYIPAGHLVHSDEPPEYTDSAEEADKDTDSDADLFQAPQLSPKPSPRKAKRFQPSHKRKLSSQYSLPLQPADPHLDSLLERSVHALEMSNTLLQSSISTQTSLSAVFALDSPGDTLEAHARNLSSRIRNNWDAQASWADDLQDISKNMEGLFGEDNTTSRRNSAPLVHPEESPISCSLPSSLLPTMRKNLRRPSLDLRRASADTATNHTTVPPRLHYSPQSRHLIATARALKYTVSTQDSEPILLPSTLGLRSRRSSSSLHLSSDCKTVSERASSSTTSLLSTPSLPPKLTDKPLEPSTPAYNMLSSFVYRPPSSGSVTPSSSFSPSFISRRRDSSNGSASTERGYARRSSSPSSHKSLDKSHHHQDRCGTCSTCLSAVSNPLLNEPLKRGALPMVLRPMTPPAEESSSSSSDSCVAKRTVQSLRKILDDQATLQSNGHANGSPSLSIYRSRLRAPPFLPRSPAPVAEAGTSTATASISRLLTKGTHSSSTRPPTPPRSAMKKSPSASSVVPPTPTSTPTPSNSNSSLSFPGMVVKALGGSSTPSSGMSTPSKRISFAELPESYASTRPNGGSSKFKNKHSRRRNGVRGKGKEQASPERWWSGWLPTGGLGVHGLAMNLARAEERMEDRMTRNWSGKIGTGFSNHMDDWAV